MCHDLAVDQGVHSLEEQMIKLVDVKIPKPKKDWVLVTIKIRKAEKAWLKKNNVSPTWLFREAMKEVKLVKE